MAGEQLPDADALAKRAEIARVLGARRHAGELSWTMPSRPSDAAALLMATYGDDGRGRAIFIGHGTIEDGRILFAEPYLLAYTENEWTAFVESVKDDEFDLHSSNGDTGSPNPPTLAESAVAEHNMGLPEGGLWLVLDETGFIELPVANAA
jgi:hypothetical protein